jgi:hypothetical protein
MFTTQELEQQKLTVLMAQREYERLFTVWENASSWDRIWKNHKKELDRAYQYYQDQLELQRQMMVAMKLIADDEEIRNQKTTFSWASIVPVVLSMVVIAAVIFYLKKRKK